MNLILILYASLVMFGLAKAQHDYALTKDSYVEEVERRILLKLESKFETERPKYEARTAYLEQRLKATEERLLSVEADLHQVVERLADAEQTIAFNEHSYDSKQHKRRDEHIQGSTDPARVPESATFFNSIVKRVTRQERLLIPGTDETVAFTAKMSNTAAELGKNHIIPFDIALLNEGSGFDTLLHVFTCPTSGVYVFMTSLLCEYHENIVTEITQNGTPLVLTYAAGSSAGHGYDQGFNSVITKCAAGDRVWVQVHDHQGTTVHHWSTFSGFRLN